MPKGIGYGKSSKNPFVKAAAMAKGAKGGGKAPPVTMKKK